MGRLWLLGELVWLRLTGAFMLAMWAGIGGTGTLSTVCMVWTPMYRRASGLWLWMSGLLAERIRCDIPFAACCPDMGGKEGRCVPRPLAGGLLKYEFIFVPSLEAARDIAGAVYRLGSSFQLADGCRPYGYPADWELDLVDGVSATGEK